MTPTTSASLVNGAPSVTRTQLHVRNAAQDWTRSGRTPVRGLARGSSYHPHGHPPQTFRPSDDPARPASFTGAGRAVDYGCLGGGTTGLRRHDDPGAAALWALVGSADRQDRQAGWRAREAMVSDRLGDAPRNCRAADQRPYGLAQAEDISGTSPQSGPRRGRGTSKGLGPLGAGCCCHGNNLDTFCTGHTRMPGHSRCAAFLSLRAPL
jgi:hypothetical protein